MQGLELRTLSKNFAATFSRQLGTGVLQLAIAVIIARVYGPEGNGTFAVALLLPSILATFLNLGIAPANVYYLGSNQVALRSLMHANIRIYLPLVIIGVALAAITLLWKGDKLFPGIEPELLWLALAAFPLNLLQSFLMSAFQGLQRFRVFNLILLVQPTLMLMLVGSLAVLESRDIALLIIANLLSTLASIGLALWQLKRMLDAAERRHQDAKYLRQAISYGWKAHFSNILAFVNYKADVFLVNFFLGSAATGVYVIAVTVVERLWLVSHGVSTVLLPRLSQLSCDETKRKQLTPLVSRWVLTVSLLGGIVLAIIAQPLIAAVFGLEYMGAVLPLLILLPGIVLTSASRVLANDIAARGRPELNMYTSLIVVAANIVGNLALIPSYGLAGAALATSLAYTLNLLLRLVIYARFTRDRWTESLLLKSSDICMVAKSVAKL